MGTRVVCISALLAAFHDFAEEYILSDKDRVGSTSSRAKSTSQPTRLTPAMGLVSGMTGDTNPTVGGIVSARSALTYTNLSNKIAAAVVGRDCSLAPSTVTASIFVSNTAAASAAIPLVKLDSAYNSNGTDGYGVGSPASGWSSMLAANTAPWQQVQLDTSTGRRAASSSARQQRWANRDRGAHLGEPGDRTGCRSAASRPLERPSVRLTAA